jgi:hypothetical protein
MRALLQAVDEVIGREDPWPGLPTIDPQALPCCTFVGLVLLTWQEKALDDPTWGLSSPWWADLNIWDRARPWSSVDAAADFGRLVEALLVGCLHVAQIWKGAGDGTVDPGDKGHTILVLALPGGAVLVLDSMESRGYRAKLWASWGAYLDAWEVSWGGVVEARLVRLSNHRR